MPDFLQKASMDFSRVLALFATRLTWFNGKTTAFVRIQHFFPPLTEAFFCQTENFCQW